MLELKTDNFDEETKTGTVLVDFWAPWCGPCKMMGSILEMVRDSFSDDDSITICKVNVDEEPELAKKFGVTNIPTLAFMKDGEVAKVVSGVQSAPVIKEALKTLKDL